MKKLKKILAATLSVTLASALVGCSPQITIGEGSSVAMTVEGYEVPAGLFIYYTLQGYSDAQTAISNSSGSTPELNDVKNASIDNIDSTTWIQDKAVEYCLDYVTIVKEFDSIGGELPKEDVDSAKQMANYYYSMNGNLEKNGVSLETMEKMAQMTYKEDAVFKHYYDIGGEYSCTEDELKDYFDENFARVKYMSISLIDDEGNPLDEDEQRARRKKAESYVKQINKKSDELDKMHEVDKVKEDFDEYLAAQTTTAEGEEEVTTTTTTTTVDSEETTTTTSTSPYENERLIQKYTTTTAADSGSSDTTTTAEESESEKNTRLFNEFVFNDLKRDEAVIYDYSDEMIYVIVRADLRERMTEDDYWSEDYINNMLHMKFYDEFVEKLNEKSKVLSYDKNEKAFRRYEPFKLELAAEQ